MAQITFLNKVSASRTLNSENFLSTKGYDMAGNLIQIGTLTSGSSGNFYSYNSVGNRLTVGIETGTGTIGGSTVSCNTRFAPGKYVLLPNILNQAGEL